MAVHTLATMPWTAVRDLPAGRTVAVLPTGAIEAHGPHLPLGTDIVIATAMARRGAEQLSARGYDVLLLPALPYAPAPYAAGFPGTIHTPPDVITATVASIAHSLAQHGITVMALANAHHDPAQVDALRAAVAAAGREPRCTVIFPDLTKRRWAERLTDEFRAGCHAGRYEGSIVLAEAPDTVQQDVMATLPPNPRSLVDAVRANHLTFEQAGGPLAYFGTPAEATGDEGRVIVGLLGAILAEAVLEVLEPDTHTLP